MASWRTTWVRRIEPRPRHHSTNSRLQPLGHRAPLPTAAPGPIHQGEIGHSSPAARGALRRMSIPFSGTGRRLSSCLADIIIRNPSRSRFMLDPFVYKSDRLRVLFGRGTVARLGEEAERHKMTRALVLCSQGRGALGESIGARLGARFAGVCNAARPGMPGAAFDEVVAALERAGADGFVCVGGGSPIGLAKAVAAATKTPYIAVVTTYSGSEMAPRWYLGTGADERSG